MDIHPVRIYRYLRNGLSWRLRRLLGDPLVDRIIVKLAQRWRPLLKNAVFIGITGSCGKTTTKQLLLGILSRAGRPLGNPASLNAFPEVAKTLLRVRPRHTSCVVELSEDRPSVMDAPLALLQPSIGIVTLIGNDHWSAFSSRDGIAEEVAKLVACLPATGTAVLNADDELVLAMAANRACKRITYGVSPRAQLRAESINSAWPDRLALTLVWGAERVRVPTQLCGSHWIPSVLGAIGGGLATGVPLLECAEDIAGVAPFEGRMQPVLTAAGVTFIRDDFKAPLWTVDSCFEFLKAARAKRKLLVIGTLSDCGSGTAQKYEKVARRAQDIADLTIFVGPWASHVLKARKPGSEDALCVFRNVRDAAEYIAAHTREGDLVLLKGTNKQDHLLRIILARTEGVACWRDDCKRDSFCDACPHLTKASGSPVLMGSGHISAGAAPRIPPPALRPIEADETVIVGLGNSESRYSGTPHNIGYEVVEQLAVSLQLKWKETPEVWIARGLAQDRSVCLVKIRGTMNLVGAGLKWLSESLSFDPGQCILVHDDLDRPLGSVRTRLSGGAGGHRGVASILEAFQSDGFRRVKVGVGQAAAKLNRVEYVLTAFDAASRSALDPAICVAKVRTLELVERSQRFGRQSGRP